MYKSRVVITFKIADANAFLLAAPLTPSRCGCVIEIADHTPASPHLHSVGVAQGPRRPSVPSFCSCLRSGGKKIIIKKFNITIAHKYYEQIKWRNWETIPENISFEIITQPTHETPSVILRKKRMKLIALAIHFNPKKNLEQ